MGSRLIAMQCRNLIAYMLGAGWATRARLGAAIIDPTERLLAGPAKVARAEQALTDRMKSVAEFEFSKQRVRRACNLCRPDVLSPFASPRF